MIYVIKDYIQQNYETESGKLAQIIIPKDATQNDLAAISDMLAVLIRRRFKTEPKQDSKNLKEKKDD